MQLEKNVAMDTWMRLRPARLESRFTKQMSQLCPIPLPLCPLLSDDIRLLARLRGRFGPLYRFNGSSGTHRPAKERRGTRDRRTNGDGETKDPERKEPRQKNEDALFYPARTNAGNYGAKRDVEGGKEDQGDHARGRGGVWSNLLKGVVSPEFIFHKLCTRVEHTPRTPIRESHSCAFLISTKSEIL